MFAARIQHVCAARMCVQLVCVCSTYVCAARMCVQQVYSMFVILYTYHTNCILFKLTLPVPGHFAKLVNEVPKIFPLMIHVLDTCSQVDNIKSNSHIPTQQWTMFRNINSITEVTPFVYNLHVYF